MKKYLQTLIFSIILLSSLIPAYPEVLSIGNEDDWIGTKLQNLETTAGRGGYMDLVIKTTELSAGSSTDLLLPFNTAESFDRTGHYRIVENPDYNREFLKTGSGSAAFFSGKKMVLQADEGALLSAHTSWEDFTIEFWLYPANPKEGEEILQWKGLGRQDKQIYSQTIQCHFLNRKLVWSFDNFFQLPESPYSHFEITGDPLLPRQWHHHMLRFDSSTGMLEYLIDGTPSAIIYTTETGDESHKVYTPRIGEEPGELTIGEYLTGFIDEFRIDTRFIENRSLNRFYKPGFGLSSIIDLQYPGSELKKIDFIQTTPGNSEVFPYFFISNNRLEAEQIYRDFQGEMTILDQSTPWKSFREINDEDRGRFLIVSFLLYPDLKMDLSPLVSSVEIEYVSSLPPLPPGRVRIERQETGTVLLSWNPSPSSNIEGYLIFYGEKPGEYIYSGSPLNAGNSNSAKITGLSPFKQYFFAIKSYNKGEIPQYSDFSEEISIRP